MRKGSGFKPGPQVDTRINSIGAGGRTSLSLPIAEEKTDRDFAGAKAQWEKEKEEAAKAKK